MVAKRAAASASHVGGKRARLFPVPPNSARDLSQKQVAGICTVKTEAGCEGWEWDACRDKVTRRCSSADKYDIIHGTQRKRQGDEEIDKKM